MRADDWQALRGGPKRRSAKGRSNAVPRDCRPAARRRHRDFPALIVRNAAFAFRGMSGAGGRGPGYAVNGLPYGRLTPILDAQSPGTNVRFGSSPAEGIGAEPAGR